MTHFIDKIPLVAAYQQTKEVWSDFTPEQKRAATLASAATFGRLALRIAVEYSQDSGRLSRKQALLAHVALDCADTLDGRIARAGNAVTPWGKVADPLADKVDFAIQDIARVRRGEMGGVEAGIRIIRDTGSTMLRHYESLHPGQEGARTAATSAGKGSSILRVIANRVGDAAPESKVATATRHTATAGLIGSFISNWRDFRRNRA
jgi:phosphatidylglycerophosphate synthase